MAIAGTSSKKTADKPSYDMSPAIGTVEPTEPLDLGDLFEKKGTGIKRHARNVLTVGKVGVGKTTAFSTIPQEIIDPDTGELVPAKVLHIDTDGKGNVIDRDKVPHFDFMRLPYDPANHLDTYKKLNALVYNLNNKVEGYADYNIGILDGLTPIDLMLWEISYLPPPVGVGTHRIANDKNHTEYEIGIYDTDYTLGADKNYEFHKRAMGFLTFSLQNRFKYFFVTAHIKEPLYAAKKQEYAPDVHGSTKELLPKLFHEVYYVVEHGVDAKARPKWEWLTRATGMYAARSCLPVTQYIPMDYSIITNGNWEKYRDDKPEAKE